MKFKAYKELFVDELGLEMAYHKRIVNYCLQTMEDVTMFVTECLSKFQNVVQAIMNLKKLKQNQLEESFHSEVIFTFSAEREGKAAYEKLLCEEITDHDYRNLQKHPKVDVYKHWDENRNASAMSIHKDLSAPVKVVKQSNGEDLFAGLI